MDKANLVEYYLDIILGCPHCDYVFELSTHEIPTEGSTYHVCEKCQIPLEVKPVSIKIKFKKSIKLKNKDRKRDCLYGKPKSEASSNKAEKSSKRSSKKNSKYEQQNKAVQKAKVFIKSCGFTEEQFYNGFNQVQDLYEPGWEPISAEALVKEVLARIDNKHESTKT